MTSSPKQAIIKKLTEALQQTTDPAIILALTDRIQATERQGNDESLWDLQRAAAWMGIQPDTLRKWCSRRIIPCIKIRSKTMFHPDRLKRWAIGRETQIAEAHRR